MYEVWKENRGWEMKETIDSIDYDSVEYLHCIDCFYFSPEAKHTCTNKRQKECVENNFKYFTKNL